MARDVYVVNAPEGETYVRIVLTGVPSEETLEDIAARLATEVIELGYGVEDYSWVFLGGFEDCIYDFSCQPDTCWDENCPDRGTVPEPRLCGQERLIGSVYCSDHSFIDEN